MSIKLYIICTPRAGNVLIAGFLSILDVLRALLELFALILEVIELIWNILYFQEKSLR